MRMSSSLVGAKVALASNSARPLARPIGWPEHFCLGFCFPQTLSPSCLALIIFLLVVATHTQQCQPKQASVEFRVRAAAQEQHRSADRDRAKATAGHARGLREEKLSRLFGR